MTAAVEETETPAAVGRRLCCADSAAGLVLAAALVWHGNWMLAVIASVVAVFWIGATAMAALNVSPASGVTRCVLAVGCGFPLFALALLPANLIAGYAHSPIWVWHLLLAGSLLAVCATLKWAANARGVDAWRWVDLEVDGFSLLVIFVPPALAVLAAMSLADGRSAVLSYACVPLIFAMMLVSYRYRPGAFPAALFGAFWASPLMMTFRSPYLFGYDINQEHAMARVLQAWTPVRGEDPYRSMLSITLVPRSLAALFGLAPLDFLKILAPAALALAALGCFQMCRLWAADGVAAIAVAAVVVLTSTYQLQMGAIARQEFAFLVLVAAVVAGHSVDIDLRTRRVVFAALLCSLAFIHYTTSYVTVAMLALSFLVGRVTLGDQRHLFMVSGRALVAVVGCVALWNGVVTDSGSGLTHALGEIRQEGLNILPSDGSAVQSWLKSTSVPPLSAEQYSAAMAARVTDGDLGWVKPSPFAEQFPLVDSAAPSERGALAGLAGLWNLTTVANSQLLLLSSLVLTLISLRAAIKRKDPFLMLLACFVTGSVLFSSLLRLSGSASTLYNPERQALLTALFTAPLIAASLEWGFHRRVVRAGATAMLTVSSILGLGLAPALFGGSRSPLHSSTGEIVERFVILEQDDAAANWMSSAAPAGALVQTDRYGQLAVEGIAGRSYGWVPTVAPVALDENSYVMESSATARSGRARGDSGGALAVFEFPRRFLDATRTVVYANGKVTLWH